MIENKPGNPEADRDIFIVTEVQNKQALVDELSRTAPELTSFQDEAVSENLAKLIKLSERARRKLFVVETTGGSWTVVANSNDDVNAVRADIRAVSDLQSSIDPKGLPGMCIYAHEHASVMGVGDGSLSSGSKPQEESIYPILGIHHVGYKDNQSTGKTLIFDLTSKIYVFTPRNRTTTAVCQGIMMVEEKGETKILEAIYSTDWKRKPFDHSQFSINPIMDMWIKPK